MLWYVVKFYSLLLLYASIITFSKVMVMYFYALKMIKFGATCITDHTLHKQITMIVLLEYVTALLEYLGFCY